MGELEQEPTPAQVEEPVDQAAPETNRSRSALSRAHSTLARRHTVGVRSVAIRCQ